MLYLMLIYHSETAWSGLKAAEQESVYREYRQLIDELTASGKYRAGNQLESAAAAATVRIRDGKSVVTDGPFVETKEQLAGFFYIEARDMEEAIGIAARIPSAREGTIEVRPVIPRQAGAQA